MEGYPDRTPDRIMQAMLCESSDQTRAAGADAVPLDLGAAQQLVEGQSNLEAAERIAGSI